MCCKFWVRCFLLQVRTGSEAKSGFLCVGLDTGFANHLFSFDSHFCVVNLCGRREIFIILWWSVDFLVWFDHNIIYKQDRS